MNTHILYMLALFINVKVASDMRCTIICTAKKGKTLLAKLWHIFLMIRKNFISYLLKDLLKQTIDCYPSYAYFKMII